MLSALEVLSTDVRFFDSPDAGDPACVCSRCGSPIGEHVVPVRMWPAKSLAKSEDYEYRFHPQCLGLEVYADLGEYFDNV